MIEPGRSGETLTFAMPQNGTRKANGHPALAACFVASLAALPLGVVGWIWSGDWRWAATGVLIMLALAIVTVAVSVMTSRPRS
jgi:hypothetical protein